MKFERSIYRVLFCLLLCLCGLRVSGGRGALAQTDGAMQSTQDGGLVGTWYTAGPLLGGVSHQFYSFNPGGHWTLVSMMEGGVRNGQEVQRWGRWQARQMANGTYQVQVVIQGGAPKQFCTQGGGCSAVTIPQTTMNLQLQVRGDQMRQGDGTIFKRAQLPQQLAQQLPDTIMQQGPPQIVIPGGGGSGRNPNGSATNTPGLGNNCDNLQQQRVCTVNDGHMYTDNRGCRMCAAP